MKKKKLAIVGATGLVGQSVMQVLFEENLLNKFDLTLFVSEKNSNKDLRFKNKVYKLCALNSKQANEKYDYAIFSAGDDVSKVWAYHFLTRGAVVIDNTNAFRRREDIPLVVPEINSQLIKNETKLIANPNCSTIELVLALDKLKKLGEIKKVVVSTYQSVSGAGSKALDDLNNKTRFVFEKGIENNAIAEIGKILKTDYSTEEDKIMFESKKILNKEFEIFASAVRVPIAYCHLESVYVEFDRTVDISNIQNLSDKTIAFVSGIVLPTEVSGTNKTFVFRTRKCSDCSIMFFVLADNLRRGASFNAIQILKKCIETNKNKKVWFLVLKECCSA